MADLKRYTRKEIESRNTKKDAVFVIDNQVYDVTRFLDDHPGGHEVLVNVAGRDATENFEDIGHSSDAKEMMLKFRLGELVDEDKIISKKPQVMWNESSSQSESDGTLMSSWKLPVLLALVMTVLYNYLFS